MKFEEIISSFVMVVVTGLVLVGFTIAWYTNNNLPAVTGVEVMAAEMGSVQVALEPGGVDISELEDNAKYAEIGVEKFTNVDTGELAPGTYGQVTFYVKPITSAVTACNIVPMLRISQDKKTWYPVIESVDGTDIGSSSDGGNNGGEDVLTIEELYELANSHIEFFADAAMTQKITADNAYKLFWGDEEGEAAPLTEQAAVIYWKWHYEYPFTAEQEATLSPTEKEEYIDTYDEEDMMIGNNISAMKFYFTFSAQ